MSEELQQKLRSQLWTVANTLRGNMSASDFMYFTLGFIFYKYLSEKIELYANEILEEDHITFKEVWNGKDEELKQDVKEECIQNLGYFIEPEYLYSTIIELISKKENILPSLERSLKKIEDSTIGQDSEDDFGGLFSDLDLASPKLGKTADDKNKLISDVLIALNGIDFGLQEAGDIDILGDAYEYMISQFAAGAGKKAGEFYTPQEVSQILAEIVITGKVRLKDVFDPTCGSGSLLLRTAKSGKADSIFGQEKNPTTFNLCRMNMLLHGVKYNDFDIQNGDTLEADAFGDRQFDAVVANPPFSADWTAADKFNNDDRFSKATVVGVAQEVAHTHRVPFRWDQIIVVQIVVIDGCPFQGIQVSTAVVFLVDVLHEGTVIGIIIIVTETGSNAVPQTRIRIIMKIGVDHRDIRILRLIIEVFRVSGIVGCGEHSADTHQQGQHQSQTQKSFPMVAIHFVSLLFQICISGSLRLPRGFHEPFGDTDRGIYDQAAHSA